MSLAQWNRLCPKNSCSCLNLAGATFLCVLGDECTSEECPLSLQIYENRTFALKTYIRQQDKTNTDAENTAFGAWECCNGIWYGVAVVGFRSSLTQEPSCAGDHYVRLSLQICPASNTLRSRRVYMRVPADKCLSDVPPEAITYIGGIDECKLQRVNNVCQTVTHDFALEEIQ